MATDSRNREKAHRISVMEYSYVKIKAQTADPPRTYEIGKVSSLVNSEER